jgi:outer membrane protein OmpU
MKKVLFATTALVATAGVAAADITVSGDARMGVTTTEVTGSVDNETTFSSRARLHFTLSGETDTGLSFGASFSAHNAGATNQQRTGNAITEQPGTNGAVNGQAGTVFISGGFGTLTMGDITSAQEAATGDVAGVGYGTMSTNEMGYIGGGDVEGLAYSYAIDGLTIHATAGQRNAADADNENAFGVSYTMGDYTVAAGYAEDGARDQTSIAVRAKFGGVSLAVVSLDNDALATNKGELGVSVSYTMDALTLIAFTREVDVRAAGTVDPRYTGVGANYNLGGGASLRAGYIDGGSDGNNLDQWDLGVTFSF